MQATYIWNYQERDVNVKSGKKTLIELQEPIYLQKGIFHNYYFLFFIILKTNSEVTLCNHIWSLLPYFIQR